ncbi:MAG: hypothetical protein ACU0CO_02070 [Shimia sp.]
MTALAAYQRLETTGVWRPEAGAQRVDVAVAFGDATLVISDGSGRALAHWSLPAIVRLNPRETPAILAPGPEADEALEVADADMIDAIEQVQRAIARTRPRQGRMRFAVSVVAVVAGLGALGAWLPGAVERQALEVVPDVKRQEIGAALLTRVAGLTGAPCAAPFAALARDRLEQRLGAEGDYHVVRDAPVATATLPGGDVLIGHALIEDPETPQVVAGHLLAEAARVEARAPLAGLLDHIGLAGTLRLLATGSVSETALDGYAEALLTAPPAPVADEVLLARFRAAEVPSTAYAYARDVTGETTLPLIEADPFQGVAVRPVLDDGDWLSLRTICEG